MRAESRPIIFQSTARGCGGLSRLDSRHWDAEPERSTAVGNGGNRIRRPQSGLHISKSVPDRRFTSWVTMELVSGKSRQSQARGWRRASQTGKTALSSKG
jgi:hypothetical protein